MLSVLCEPDTQTQRNVSLQNYSETTRHGQKFMRQTRRQEHPLTQCKLSPNYQSFFIRHVKKRKVCENFTELLSSGLGHETHRHVFHILCRVKRMLKTMKIPTLQKTTVVLAPHGTTVLATMTVV